MKKILTSCYDEEIFECGFFICSKMKYALLFMQQTSIFPKT